MTKYKLSNKQKMKYVMREKPSRVKIIEYNEQINVLKIINELIWFFKIKKQSLWKRSNESLIS